jgi:carboxyl-terminal processing protease
MEMTSPGGRQYKSPIIVLVGRWTASMGEVLAINLDDMNRAQIVDTEMKRLASSDYDFQFAHRNYGYKVIVEKPYYINCTPRKMFVPKQYVTQSTIAKDEASLKAMALLSVAKAYA